MSNKETPKIVLRGFVVGEYGVANTVVLKDLDGVAQDVSSYTTKQVIVRSPDGRKRITCTASFTTDGSDGSIYWTFSSSDPMDRPGFWEGQAVMTKTNADLKSYPFDMEAKEKI